MLLRFAPFALDGSGDRGLGINTLNNIQWPAVDRIQASAGQPAAAVKENVAIMNHNMAPDFNIRASGTIAP